MALKKYLPLLALSYITMTIRPDAKVTLLNHYRTPIIVKMDGFSHGFLLKGREEKYIGSISNSSTIKNLKIKTEKGLQFHSGIADEIHSIERAVQINPNVPIIARITILNTNNLLHFEYKTEIYPENRPSRPNPTPPSRGLPLPPVNSITPEMKLFVHESRNYTLNNHVYSIQNGSLGQITQKELVTLYHHKWPSEMAQPVEMFEDALAKSRDATNKLNPQSPDYAVYLVRIMTNLKLFVHDLYEQFYIIGV